LNALSSVQRRVDAAAQVFVDDIAVPELRSAELHHLRRVRRLKDGEQVVVADGSGAWRFCRLIPAGLEVDGEIELEPAPGPLLTVAFAPVKGERSEWAVAKLTELGVDRIAPLLTERAAVRWQGASGAKALERWRRVADEACSQSRRVRRPEILTPIVPATLVGVDGAALAVLGGPALKRDCRIIAVGPEGGWSPAERDLGLDEVGLGTGLLRSETAAVAAGVLFGASRAGTVAAMDPSEAPAPAEGGRR